MKILIISLIFGLLVIPFSSNADQEEWDKLVNKVKERLNCTPKQAEQFIAYVDNFVTIVQDNFIYLASDKNSNKEERIKHTIEKYFEKPTSSVQVSSISRRTIKTIQVSVYLSKLADLSKNGTYTKVELLYEPSYLGMGEIKEYIDPNYGRSYELSVTMWQIFRGYIGDGIAYEDATQKMFGLVFHKEKDYWLMKIRFIGVKGGLEGTVTPEEFEQIKNRWRNE